MTFPLAINSVIRALILLLMLVSVAIAQDIPPPPNPPRLVNDFAGALSNSEREALERKLNAYHDTTSTQIAVVIVKNLGGYEVMDYAFRIGETWGVGQKGKENGVVILVAIDDRKAAIATGYGLEGAIPDIATRHIRENQMNPNFREGNFYKGLDEATTTIMKLASGEYTADDMQQELPPGAVIAIGVFLVFLAIMFITIIAVASRKRNHIGSKGIDFWTALWLMSHMGKGNRGGKSGWGGGSGWGGFGGGSSGGGFGGFGGGSFGGGGSGGSW
jgi:uncharacterized protein